MRRHDGFKNAVFALLLVLLLALSAPFAFAASKTPGKVQLSVKAVTQTSATLQWKAAAGADGYLIYQYDYAAKSFDRIAVTSKTAVTVPKLTGGESYCFGVRAYAQTGKTLVKGKLVKAKCYTPLATVTGIKQTETTPVSHKLQWKAVPGAEEYQIYYFKDSVKSFALLGTVQHPYCTVKKLKSASVGQYKVRAVSHCANGKTVKAKTSAIFYAYTNPADIARFTAEDVTTTGYTLVWDAVEGADGYRLFRYNPKSGKYSRLADVEGTTYEIDGLTPCSTAFYKICAFAKLNGTVRYGARTSALPLTTKPETVTPVLLARPAANGVMKVGWNQGVCDGYLIFGAAQEEGPYELIDEIDDPNTLSCSIRSPFDSETLYVRIKTFVMVDSIPVMSAYSDALVID